MKKKDSVNEMWLAFTEKQPEYKHMQIPEAWYFCDNEKDANECAELVVKGIKRATSPSLWWFKKNKQALPSKGDLNIITDWDGNAKAIIETISVEKIPFNKINAEHAKIEGEGDKSLEYWKRTHWEYYTREMKLFNKQPSEDMIVVFEQFKTIFN